MCINNSLCCYNAPGNSLRQTSSFQKPLGKCFLHVLLKSVLRLFSCGSLGKFGARCASFTCAPSQRIDAVSKGVVGKTADDIWTFNKLNIRRV